MGITDQEAHRPSRVILPQSPLNPVATSIKNVYHTQHVTTQEGVQGDGSPEALARGVPANFPL